MGTARDRGIGGGNEGGAREGGLKRIESTIANGAIRLQSCDETGGDQQDGAGGWGARRFVEPQGERAKERGEVLK